MKDVLGYEGKRVIVSGAASGMGAATTELLVELGAEVHAVDIKKPDITGLASAFNDVGIDAQLLLKKLLGPLATALQRSPTQARWRYGFIESLAIGWTTDGADKYRLGWGDRNRFEVSEDIGEPQPDEPDVPFLQRAQHEFLLTVHDRSVGTGC